MDIKLALSVLGNACLEASGEPGDFNGDDLVNALLILQHVAHSISWNHQDMSFEQREIIAVEFGKNLRQSVMLFTGLDPHDCVADQWAETLEDSI